MKIPIIVLWLKRIEIVNTTQVTRDKSLTGFDI